MMQDNKKKIAAIIVSGMKEKQGDNESSSSHEPEESDSSDMELCIAIDKLMKAIAYKEVKVAAEDFKEAIELAIGKEDEDKEY